MFHFNRSAELDEKTLNKMISAFNVSVKPTLVKYDEYYKGIQAILDKKYNDTSKPCNKLVVNYCKNIVDSYCGYLATPGYITYRGDNIEEILDILKYNDYQSEDAEFLLNALIYGVAAELMYVDTEGKTRFKLINPLTCFGVYDDSLTNDLLYFVRIYQENEWADNDTYLCDVYSDSYVRHYSMKGIDGNVTYIGEDQHYFSQCPANIFYLPDEKSIFDCILSLQDAANTTISAEIDDYESFCDAYLAITGADADEESVSSMKENRVLVLPEGASAQWLIKQVNDGQVENILKRLEANIYRIAATPDFSSESFIGGVSSGVAIQYRLTGMETRAGKIEASMRQALQRRIEIICGIASLKLGEEVFREITIDFNRNIPNDITSVINNVNTLRGFVSDETLLGQLDFVDDVSKEAERVERQKEEERKLYSFGYEEEKEEVEE